MACVRRRTLQAADSQCCLVQVCICKRWLEVPIRVMTGNPHVALPVPESCSTLFLLLSVCLCKTIVFTVNSRAVFFTNAACQGQAYLSMGEGR